MKTITKITFVILYLTIFFIIFGVKQTFATKLTFGTETCDHNTGADYESYTCSNKSSFQ